MSKLYLDSQVPATYDKAVFASILRAVMNEVNPLAEGKIAGRYAAQASVPSSVAAQVGDIVWDNNPTVTSGTVRVGWICNVASLTNATFQEIRVFTSNARGVLGTEVATTSGTSVDFTGIPSWVTEIELTLVGVTTSGTNNLVVQIGDSGGIESSGYVSSAAQVVHAAATVGATETGGFIVTSAWSAAALAHGRIVLTLEDSSDFTWALSGSIAVSGSAQMQVSAGSKSLSATLDRIRLTTVGASDTFDGGVVNIRMS